MLNMFTSLITGIVLIAGLIKDSKGNIMYVIIIVLAKPQIYIAIDPYTVYKYLIWKYLPIGFNVYLNIATGSYI